MRKSLRRGRSVKMIPKQFECMGSTVVVSIEDCGENADGHYHGRETRITIAKDSTKQNQEQTFWHEYMHCALTHLGYDKLNSNEQFVDQMAQCLYQLQKTRKNK